MTRERAKRDHEGEALIVRETERNVERHPVPDQE
jgi:hypothetical protein